MFIRCRRICAARERREKPPLRYSKYRPRHSDSGRDRPLLGTPSLGGRFRLNIEQRPVTSNRFGLVEQLPRARSMSVSKELDPELPETVEDSLLRHPGAVPVSSHSRTSRRTLMEVGDDQIRGSSVFTTRRRSRTYRRDVAIFGARQLVRMLHEPIPD